MTVFYNQRNHRKEIMNDRRLFDEMYEMTVSEIMDSKTISLEDKDEFFEEIQLTLMERIDESEYEKDFFDNEDYYD